MIFTKPKPISDKIRLGAFALACIAIWIALFIFIS